MKKKTAAILLSTILLAGCGTSVQQTISVPGGNAPAASADEQKLFADDAQQLVYAVEAAHPAFVIDELMPQDYAEASKEFLANAGKAANRDEFEIMINRYLSSLNDSHTAIIKGSLPDDSILNSLGKLSLDISFSFRADKIYLNDENGEITESEILSVGGVPTDKILSVVSEIFPTDTPFMEKDIRHKYLFDKEVLTLCGCDTTPAEIEVVCSDGTVNAAFTESAAKDLPAESKTAEAKMIDDIFYIDVNSFYTKDEDFIQALDKAREYTQNGGSKVIIDVRDNIGGKYDLVSDLINCFDMNIPAGRTIIRHTNGEWQSVKNDLKAAVADKTFSDYPSSVNMAKANPNIDLAVLSNENTTGVALALCTGVKDGKIGTVLGKASHDSPKFYYNPVEYVLPGTQITVKISSAYRFRPDETNFQEMFVPNEIIFDEDPIQFVIDNHFNATEEEAEEEPYEELDEGITSAE